MTDHELETSIDSLALAPAGFTHREHVQLAFAVLAAQPDFAAAAVRYRALLRRFAEAHGAAAKYHETITWAYLALIAERMHGREYASSAQLIADHPDLLDHRGGALARCYDIGELIASPLARAVFVLPRRP
ncbi:MAG TPA: hypothetical protein VMJ10_25185 [Kofleriaceae bacterium]|nr:hypothetical protein [Kofleriaceae bacterium]